MFMEKNFQKILLMGLWGYFDQKNPLYGGDTGGGGTP